MPKLKRCPFCGALPHIQDQKMCGEQKHRIACYGENCATTPATSWLPTLNEAAKAWNNRK
jgi:hypothetical protein